MAAEKALAIVVRGTDWSETSRIATLFTREFGKVRALAKGGRRLKSNFDVAFDLLTVCEIVFLRKASGLDLLTEARMNEQFSPLRRNLPALYAGYYVAELLADGTQDYDPHVPLFDAAIQTLRSLGAPDAPSQQEVGTSISASVSAFELVWLHELGYSPRLDACATCGRERLNPTARAFFSPTAGGVLCPECGPMVADRRMVSGAALESLRTLNGGEGAPELPAEMRVEVRQLLGYAVSCVLGRRPRLLSYVDGRLS
jgi:DNA repair protein RecO (recombination protein O)